MRLRSTRAADAVGPARGADHGDRGRLEEGLHRGYGGQPVAVLEALDGAPRERGREFDPQAVALRMDFDREAAVTQHLDHPVVLRASPRRRRSRSRATPRPAARWASRIVPRPCPCISVCDGEGDFGPAGGELQVDAMADRRVALAVSGEQPVLVLVVDLGQPLGGEPQVDGAGEEAERLRAAGRAGRRTRAGDPRRRLAPVAGRRSSHRGGRHRPRGGRDRERSPGQRLGQLPRVLDQPSRTEEALADPLSGTGAEVRGASSGRRRSSGSRRPGSPGRWGRRGCR